MCAFGMKAYRSGPSNVHQSSHALGACPGNREALRGAAAWRRHRAGFLKLALGRREARRPRGLRCGLGQRARVAGEGRRPPQDPGRMVREVLSRPPPAIRALARGPTCSTRELLLCSTMLGSAFRSMLFACAIGIVASPAAADINDRIDQCERNGGGACVFDILRELAASGGESCPEGMVRQLDGCFGYATTGESCAEYCADRGRTALVDRLEGNQCQQVAEALGVAFAGVRRGSGFGCCLERSILYYSRGAAPDVRSGNFRRVCECR